MYDYQGRRIKKDVFSPPTYDLPTTTYYLYDLFGNLIYEYNVTANKTSEHVYLGSERIARIDNSNPIIALVPWYDQPKKRTMYAGAFVFGFGIVAFFGIAYSRNGKKKYLVLLLVSLGCLGGAAVLGFLVLPTTAQGQGTGDTVYYYHNDHLGSPLLITDTDTGTVWKADYLPFGEVQIDPASAITNNFRFPGQYYDEETGLYYNWFRYYSPELGRYLTPDPIGLSGGINLFSYAYQNPIYYYDPVGLASSVKIGGAQGGKQTNGSWLYTVGTVIAGAIVVANPAADTAILAGIGLTALIAGQEALKKSLPKDPEVIPWPPAIPNPSEYQTTTEVPFDETPFVCPQPINDPEICIASCRARFEGQFIKRQLCIIGCILTSY